MKAILFCQPGCSVEPVNQKSNGTTISDIATAAIDNIRTIAGMDDSRSDIDISNRFQLTEEPLISRGNLALVRGFGRVGRSEVAKEVRPIGQVRPAATAETKLVGP